MLKKINLQLFGDAPAEGQAPSIETQLGNLFDSASTATPQPETPEAPATPTNETVPPQSVDNPPTTDKDTPPIKTEQQPEPPLILGKFKTPDEAYKSYSNLESSYTKVSMEKAEIARQMEELKRQNEELSKGKQTIQEKEPNPEPVDPEEFLSKFYENPFEAINKVVETTTKKVRDEVKKEVKAEMEAQFSPITEKYEQQEIQQNWDRTVKSFIEQKPDFLELKEDIGQFIQERGFSKEKDPAIIAKVLEDGYYRAKGMKAQPQTPAPSVDDLLKSEDVIAKILSKPDIVDRAVKQRMQNIQNTPVPKMINNNSGTSTATPPEAPKTLEEAHKQLSARLMNNMA